jgi:hypothetical protein
MFPSQSLRHAAYESSLYDPRRCDLSNEIGAPNAMASRVAKIATAASDSGVNVKAKTAPIAEAMGYYRVSLTGLKSAIA